MEELARSVKKQPANKTSQPAETLPVSSDVTGEVPSYPQTASIVPDETEAESDVGGLTASNNASASVKDENSNTEATADEGLEEDPLDELPQPAPAGQKTSAPAHDQEFDVLFAHWRATGDPRARERLILMHRNLVTYLARRFLDRGELYDDIMQQGLIGLINALDHFDPNRGVRFATFATPTIIGEIRRYFRDKTWTVRVPRRLQELHQVIHRKIDALTQELDRSPTYYEIARSLNIDVEQVIEAQEMSHAMEPASLDEPTSGDGDSTMSVADHIGAPDPALEHWSEHAALHTALERLPQRQQTVLKLAYFEGFSQAEIARRIHVSPMHVSRLQRRALAQLREYLEDSSI